MTDQPISNLPDWKIIQSNPDRVNDLIEGLSGITDPEMGLSIIQLGLIRNVKIEDDSVQLKMILTTPFCPYGPALIEMARQKAESAVERPAFIDFSMEVWDFSMMEEGLGADWGIY